MKRKSLKRSSGGSRKRGEGRKMRGAPARSSQPTHQTSLFSFRPQPPPPSFPPFQNLQDSESAQLERNQPPVSAHDSDAPDENLDFILSQDFFW